MSLRLYRPYGLDMSLCASTCSGRQSGHTGSCAGRRCIGDVYDFDIEGQVLERLVARHRLLVIGQISGDI